MCVFLKEKMLENMPYYAKNAKMVNLLMSYFKVLGIWMKTKIMKKFTSISVLRKQRTTVN